MNIHPLFVHFPIAFFILYCVLEILRFNSLKQQNFYFYVKALVVIVGALSSYPTIIAGVISKLNYDDPVLQPVVNFHETFAISSAVLFSIIAFFYLIGWMRRSNNVFLAKRASSNFWINLHKIEIMITNGKLGVVLAIIGLGLISTTAALGGFLAYGPENDPISHILYQIFLKHGIISK